MGLVQVGPVGWAVHVGASEEHQVDCEAILEAFRERDYTEYVEERKRCYYSSRSEVGLMEVVRRDLQYGQPVPLFVLEGPEGGIVVEAFEIVVAVVESLSEAVEKSLQAVSAVSLERQKLQLQRFQLEQVEQQMKELRVPDPEEVNTSN